MLCGIDEAGRGCLAGPLVVVGCVLKEKIEHLADSKKISVKKREELYEIITKKAVLHVEKISNTQIDKKGLSTCMREALESIQQKFASCEIIFDGNTNFKVEGINTLIKADAKVPEVSAASIVAKVTRDKMMVEYDKHYPQYDFAKHKGYGTALHVEKIEEFGYSPLHRESFKIKSLKQKKLF